eukprot:TRINITY_DN42077_c0_g1_i1.p1 TRINITY_DN42077_c0_g1~~TRINITY_DN42077_c0_g1_i1.p1  ORF type:complete len:1013 (-),score=121.79 TRINITY_DN42077_c0_g1_i1:518-3460(-)
MEALPFVQPSVLGRSTICSRGVFRETSSIATGALWGRFLRVGRTGDLSAEGIAEALEFGKGGPQHARLWGRRRQRLWSFARRTLLCVQTILCSLLPSTVFAAMPGAREFDRISKCYEENGWVDSTASTSSQELPPCVASCPTGTDAVANQCVSAPRYSQELRLRFELHQHCRGVACDWQNPPELHLQVMAMKLCQYLKVPVQEMKSDFLVWPIPDWPVPPEVEQLKEFMIARRGEANFPRRLVEQQWYLMVMAFRVDSVRISRSTRAVRTISNLNDAEVSQYLGTDVEILRPETDSRAISGSAFAQHDYKGVFRFHGRMWNVNPFPQDIETDSSSGSSSGAVGRCTDPCYSYDEQNAPGGAHKCQDDCGCLGSRQCSSSGFCWGVSTACVSIGIPGAVPIVTNQEESETVVAKKNTTTPKPIFVEGFECGYALSTFGTAGGARIPVANVQECGSDCRTAPTCAALEYNEGTGMCFMVGEGVAVPEVRASGRYIVCEREKMTTTELSDNSALTDAQKRAKQLEERLLPSGECFAEMIKGGPATEVLSCVQSNLTTDCDAAGCHVISVATKTQCYDALCELSPKFGYWAEKCTNEKIVKKFNTAEMDCPSYNRSSGYKGTVNPADGDDNTLAVALVAVLVPVGCCLAILLKVCITCGPLRECKVVLSQTLRGNALKNKVLGSVLTDPEKGTSHTVGKALGDTFPQARVTVRQADTSPEAWGSPPEGTPGSVPKAGFDPRGGAPVPRATVRKSLRPPPRRSVVPETSPGSKESPGDNRGPSTIPGAPEHDKAQAGSDGASNDPGGDGGIPKRNSRPSSAEPSRRSSAAPTDPPSRKARAQSVKMPVPGSKVEPPPPGFAESFFGAAFGAAESPPPPTTEQKNQGASANNKSRPSYPAGPRAQSAGVPRSDSKPQATFDGEPSPETLATHLSSMKSSADVATRRRFFLAQCLRWHPDKNAGDEARSTQMFHILQEKKDWFLAET